MKAFNTIIKPVVTEKSTAQGAKHKYAFWVNRKATKIDVKNSIKEIYDADVATVHMINTAPKTRQMKRMIVDKKPPMKKALVTLKGGKKLDVTKVGKETAKK
ncbi:MAG: 50S ribosomal protein L23 [Candidatus Gracilibacteria bacterium]